MPDTIPTTRLVYTDDLTKTERIRLEALNQVVQLYQGTTRATVDKALENVGRFEKYITTGATTT